jgi:hypothetical protein
MKLSWMKMKVTGAFLLAGALTAPALAAASAVPGTVNYIEGQVMIGDQALDTHSVGTALQAGQSISTNNGKAEILLTPGVFLRLDDSSSAQMMAAGLTDTEVTLEQGHAMVEVTEIHPENNLRITEDGVSTRLLKTGLYDFDATQNQVRVFSGKAAVLDGDREVNVDGGHQLDLNVEGKLKTEKFDKDQYQQTDLYRWSSLRSSYLAEANVDAARVYVNNGYYGPGWVGAGWYWNPWYGAYTFIPAGGFFYSPFGWGFYSPLVVFRAPVSFVGHPFVHTFGPGFHSVVVARPLVTGGFRAGAVASGPRVVARGMGGGMVHGGGGVHGGGHFGGGHR